MKMTFKIWALVFFLVISLLAINPTGYFVKGVSVKTVDFNSSAYESGLKKGEVIQQINDYQISSLEDYSKAVAEVSKKFTSVNWTIVADGRTFEYSGHELGFTLNKNLTILSVGFPANNSGLSENLTLEKINGQQIENINSFVSLKYELEPKAEIKLITNKGIHEFTASSIAFTVGKIKTTNLKAGLDIQGGAKALVKPEQKVSADEITDLVSITREKLNVYGISDVVVRGVTDLSGNNYMLVEVAGATPSELKDLIGSQGKFEARIGNETVFVGGKNHIVGVCRNDASCSGIRECSQSQSGEFYCRFDFAIYLSEEAAKNQADLTSKLSENITSTGDRVLSKPLDLYLDDKLVDSLQIAYDLKGKPVTQVSINGPGFGATEQEAFDNAKQNMNKLQTVLKTGSLPFKLEIVKLDNISPLLGKEFTSNLLLASFVSILAVSFIVFIRYRSLAYTLPIILTVVSEIFIVLGCAALIQWNLDLAGIAGIIAAIGTGVDAQLIIVDESKQKVQFSIKEKIKRAFSIIFGSYLTVVVAMIPLWWAGAGMMKGFALTTILGISIGVFITRPAFSDIISQMSKSDSD